MQNLANEGVFTIIAIAGAITAGAVLCPLFLPFLPGRAFTTKGLFMGFLVALALLYLWDYDISNWRRIISGGTWVLMISAISAYLCMNFTGASTYTSLSGVKREMRWAVPLEIGTGITGVTIWTLSRFLQ